MTIPTEQKHTPGPWLLDGEPGEGCQLFHDDSVICEVRGVALHPTPDDRAEEAANTYLIAASPNMLVALVELGEAIERGDPQEIADKWLTIGKPAIAAATGKEEA